MSIFIRKSLTKTRGADGWIMIGIKAFRNAIYEGINSCKINRITQANQLQHYTTSVKHETDNKRPVFEKVTPRSNAHYMDKVVTLDDSDPSAAVQLAVSSLHCDNIIAVPTDTIYGIAGLAQSAAAISKIYAVKGRNLAKPISISVGDVKDVYRWGKVTISDALLIELLPGPVTVVFERMAALNPLLNPGTSLVGIRVPDNGFVRDVSRILEEPLALTSANISSQDSTLSVKEFEHLWPQLDLVFDGGQLGTTAQSKKGSTVVDLSKRNFYTIIREGSAFNSTVAILEQHGLREERKS